MGNPTGKAPGDALGGIGRKDAAIPMGRSMGRGATPNLNVSMPFVLGGYRQAQVMVKCIYHVAAKLQGVWLHLDAVVTRFNSQRILAVVTGDHSLVATAFFIPGSDPP